MLSVSVSALAVSLLFLSFHSLLVDASLFPTAPVANTVVVGGLPYNITWIDDHLKPPMERMGLMTIELWLDSTPPVRAVLPSLEAVPLSLSCCSVRCWISSSM